MRTKLLYIKLLSMGLTCLVCLGTASVTTAAELSPQERVEKQLGPQGNAMGVPEPGTVKDIEDTRKQPDPAQMHSPEESRQITVGGAQYFVEGEVLKIDDQNYTIKKDDTEEQVRLIVNQDTNLDCAEAPSSQEKQSDAVISKRASPEKQAPQASETQIGQGQRKDETARGAGFRIGRCDFKPGDRVKAEVDDMGRVTTLKYLAGLPASSPRSIGKSAGTGELAIPGGQEKPGQLDMAGKGGTEPKEYAVLPIPLGGFEASRGNLLLHKPVTDLHGKKVGTLENLLMDTHTGRVEYAVILIEGGTHLHPVPWAAVQLKRNAKGELNPVIDTSQYQLYPGITMKDAKDLSPSVQQLVQDMDMQILREREPRKASGRQGLGITELPAAGGEMGEEKAGGGGPSGSRALPPGKAPGFEEEQKKRD
jgi:sporulation protein YlmC with PRC-barrel domain